MTVFSAFAAQFVESKFASPAFVGAISKGASSAWDWSLSIGGVPVGSGSAASVGACTAAIDAASGAWAA